MERPASQDEGDKTAAIGRGRSRLQRIVWLLVAGAIVAVVLLPRLSGSGEGRGGDEVPSAFGTARAPSPSFAKRPGSRAGWVVYAEPTYGISIELPKTWSFRADPKPWVTDPRTLLAAGTHPLPAGHECRWLTSMPRNGAVLWLREWFQPELLGGSPADFPPRPARFELKGQTAEPHGDCSQDTPPQFTIPFEASRRYFWFNLAFGEAVPEVQRAAMQDALASVKVQTRP